jgi:hypothetical protein
MIFEEAWLLFFRIWHRILNGSLVIMLVVIHIIGTTVKQRFGPGYTVGGYCFLPIARTRPSSQGRPPVFPLEHPGQQRIRPVYMNGRLIHSPMNSATRARVCVQARTPKETF